jgi:multiple sugar transport system substrate-binding protein
MKLDRRRLIKAGAAAGVAIPAAGLLAACSSGGDDAAGGTTELAADSPLYGSNAENMQGKTLDFAYSRIAGWPPSAAPGTLWPDFQAYAKEKYGYTVNDITFIEAGFGELYQKISPTLASGSQDYNLMVVDSQWLGALSEPGWIVKADDVFAANPELDIEPYSSLVTNTYQVYPDGSGIRWGFPQMPDTQGVFLRKDMLEDPAEQAAFKAKTGKDLPTTQDQLMELEYVDLVAMIDFFHRPDKDMYGTVMMYSKDYDAFSCSYYPFAYSTGGKIWDPTTNDVYGILNTDVNAKAMDEFVGLLKYQPKNASTFFINEVLDLFNSGKAFSAWQWLAIGAFMGGDEAVVKKDMVISMPLPKWNGKLIGAMGGQPWVINAYNDDDHMRVAVDVLKWWYTKEVQDKFILENGGLPWSKEGGANPAYLEVAHYVKPFLYMLSEGRSQDFWHLPEYAEMLAVQQEAFNGYASGTVKSAKDALEYAAAKQQQILFNAGRTKTAPPENVDSLTL